MIIAAYKHASGDGISREVVLGELIDRFGVEAVMCRSYLGYNEILKIKSAENMARICQKKALSNNWVEWAQSNPDEANWLAEVEKIIAIQEGLLEDG